MQEGTRYEGAVYAISGDGKVASGWTYTKASGGEREAIFWDVENWNEETADSYTQLTFDGNPFWLSRGISPDGRYIAHNNSVYDRETDTDNVVSGAAEDTWDLTLDVVNDLGMAGGIESSGYMGSSQRAIISYLNDEGNFESKALEDYLLEQDPTIDFDSYPIGKHPSVPGAHKLLECRGISNDGTVFAICSSDTASYEHPVVVMLNRGGVVAPVAVEGEQLDGILASKLSWHAPLGSEDEISGYNIYRNGEKLNSEPVTTLSYVDNNLEEGNYTYTVSALYGDEESESSEEVNIAIAPKAVSAPTNFYARQKGVNSVALSWTKPATNLAYKTYLEPDVAIDAFGGGARSFEAGIKFDHVEMAAYEGYKLTAVNFYPLSAQEAWVLNLYDGTELVYTQPIEQELVYGEENRVELTEPFDLSTLKNDLVCGISVTLPAGVETYNVLGVNLDKQVTPGYSDLMRSSTEASEGTFLYSMYDFSVENSGSATCVSWGIGLIISSGNESEDIDDVAHYNVFVNDSKVGETVDMSYVEKNLEDGTYNVGVQAEYADGRLSDIVYTSLDIERNTAAYPSISAKVASEEGNAVRVFWDAPVDDDSQLVSYGDGTCAGSVAGPEDNGYGYWARATFSGSKIKGLGGYVIKSFSFFPTSNCEFTIMINVDNREVVNQYIEMEEITAYNTWITIPLDQEIVINEKSTYDVILDCFDNADPTLGPIGVDNQTAIDGVSNACSYDNGESWDQITQGNWMMGVNVVDPSGEPLPVDGYYVRIDDEEVNENILTDTEFVYDFGADADRAQMHKLNVDVAYTDYARVAGGLTVFTIDSASGIEDNTVFDVKVNVYPNPASSYVRVEGGDVEELAAYSVNGVLMGKTNENMLDVSSYAAGLYILQIKIDGQVKTVKLNVIK